MNNGLYVYLSILAILVIGTPAIRSAISKRHERKLQQIVADKEIKLAMITAGMTPPDHKTAKINLEQRTREMQHSEPFAE
ncbi:MAG: hypothetical protein WCO19_03455 [Candidatus Saccharibacteria bacterium]